MRWRLVGLRSLVLALWGAWVGGFMFYGAIVVPILHDELDSLTAGGITRRVTDGLNAVGAIALATWAALLIVEGRTARRIVGRARWVAFGISTGLLIGLIAMHEVMDGKLDTTGLDAFYPWHRAYLVVSTIQWVVNVGLLALSVAAWSLPTRTRSESSS